MADTVIDKLKNVKQFFEENKEAISKEDMQTVSFILKKLELKSRIAAPEEKAQSEEMKNRGNDLFREGRLDESLEMYNKALEHDITNYLVYSNRALVFMKLDQIDRAIEDCLLGIEIEPKFVKFYIRLAIIYTETDRAKASGYIEKGLAFEPENSALLEMKSNLVKNSPLGSFDTSTMDSLLKNKSLQDMVQNFVKDKSADELNSMMSSVLGKLGKK
ncbi:uncharacterized protein VICG_01877 [Vittaforma corneae ATCC 50505]|uniref:Uncharacterized protein n=1 Tax=Vittaforma corneae (strain ATCC 50505) TaxID=993615 RepID=L2GKF0_VITCO|nr:uncharacterized protein VICG_01877 [Vittaforma corneae ATCC 50505]ELA41084.1 hypothetical protein VICG_01877 [Vittaforma corneae ATCC 50505]